MNQIYSQDIYTCLSLGITHRGQLWKANEISFFMLFKLINCLFSYAIYHDVVVITVKQSVLLRSLKRELLVLSFFFTNSDFFFQFQHSVCGVFAKLFDLGIPCLNILNCCTCFRDILKPLMFVSLHTISLSSHIWRSGIQSLQSQRRLGKEHPDYPWALWSWASSAWLPQSFQIPFIPLYGKCTLEQQELQSRGILQAVCVNCSKMRDERPAVCADFRISNMLKTWNALMTPKEQQPIRTQNVQWEEYEIKLLSRHPQQLPAVSHIYFFSSVFKML